MDDLISRQEAIDAVKEERFPIDSDYAEGFMAALDKVEWILKEWLPSAQPEKRTEERTETHACDLIDRQAAIDAICKACSMEGDYHKCDGYPETSTWCDELVALRALPSAQSERTCVNCGRTINNGGWYADGRTRCPIEEHYALPKDGYCHLWEKRNVTDDDYPERREE